MSEPDEFIGFTPILLIPSKLKLSAQATRILNDGSGGIMRTICSALLLCLLAISAFAGDAVVASETPQGKLELTVKTRSSRDAPGVVTLDAVLRNLTSGEVLAEPRVVFRPRDGFNVTTKGEKDLFTASLSPTESEQATLDVEYSINGEVVFAPRVTFQLR